ncbi:hypothetical protein PL373_13330 [Tenacibaculum maritimum]|nr:hypothetical protein [Tenacibaculum maritimum]MDB0600292.1 hypothetical protein [Tenacibaculum maritimum]MDB0602111.1 hypothetical protein [Tenacibaculum maritimum]MDB0610803.1 hypothetical protein [Tenacibaculum maritimum]
MIYNAQRPSDVESAEKRFNSLIEGKKRFELTEKKGNKTPNQNRYLHLILGFFALESGYTMDYVKREFFKIECNLEIFKVVQNGIFGEVEGLRSWANLDTREAALSITRFRNWSSNTAGIYLPEANEIEFLKSIEEQLSKYNNKEFI